MLDVKNEWKSKIESALKDYANDNSIEISDIGSRLLIETPPKAELGDVSFPMFPFAKDLRMSPNRIAIEVANRIENEPGKIVFTGGYINIFVERASYIGNVLTRVDKLEDSYGKNSSLKDEKIMIEFSSPNTNKPLHLGHLRNNIIGESISRIFQCCGANIKKVNLINNRGIHICKSMLAYMKFGNSETPETTGIKGDHFVGNYYVKFNNWAKEDDSAELEAQKLLQKWEDNDTEVIKLWEKMNKWALDGINETYEKTSISFDSFYYESDTYLLGKDKVIEGLSKGIFYKENDSSIRCELSELGLESKVLLRSDGTSVYITQDLGTAIKRFNDYKFTKHFYVVATEQNYHFKILFHILKKFGYDWAENLHHLSYGMVVLPDGKMKSREGTIVDADNLIENLVNILKKNRDVNIDTVQNVAIGAIHYYLLNVNTYKDIMFNPKESISFTGNTGPYLQYTGARIQSVLNKVNWEKLSNTKLNTELLQSDDEWCIVKLIGEYPEYIEISAREYDPSKLTSYLYDLCKCYSKFYQNYSILNNDNDELNYARIVLSSTVFQVIKNCFELLNIPFIIKM